MRDIGKYQSKCSRMARKSPAHQRGDVPARDAVEAELGGDELRGAEPGVPASDGDAQQWWRPRPARSRRRPSVFRVKHRRHLGRSQSKRGPRPGPHARAGGLSSGHVPDRGSPKRRWVSPTPHALGSGRGVFASRSARTSRGPRSQGRARSPARKRRPTPTSSLSPA
jgi:hypothetical protein